MKRVAESVKSEAIRLVRESGLTVSRAAETASVSVSALNRWLSESRPVKEDSEELIVSERAELKALRKENTQLKVEREILKKASAYFAKQYL